MNLNELKMKNQKLIKKANKALAKVSKGNIVNAMAEISAHIAYFGEKKADAQFLTDRYEGRFKAIRAQVGKEIRKKVALKGTGNPSDKEVDDRMRSHSKVEEAYEDFIEAKWKHELISSFVYGLNKKADALGNMSFILTKEMDMGKLQYFGKSINNKFKSNKKRR